MDTITYVNQEVTEKVIKCSFAVHNQLGPGFMEVIYQRALARELNHQHIEFSREDWITIYYKGEALGKKRVDFVVENVIVEIQSKG